MEDVEIDLVSVLVSWNKVGIKFSVNQSVQSLSRVRLLAKINRCKNLPSRGWFRSIDLWVMGPARSRCATLLTDGLTRLLFLYYEYHEQRPISLYR